MNDMTTPATLADFMVPANDEPKQDDAPQTSAQPGENLELLDQGASEQADTRTEEQKLLDDLLSDEGGEGAEGQQEGGEAKAEIPPAPHSWSKEDAEAWAALTPEVREVVARREKERDKFVADVGRKAADQRKEVERQALEAVAQHADNYASQLSAYMSQSLPQPPDQRLLYTNNPDDIVLYQRQDAAYRAADAQQQQLQQSIAQSQQQAQMARQQAMTAQQQAEAQRLHEVLPEFFDPDTGPKLRQSLESIGQELGYPADLMAQAGANDILALKKAAEWRDKAAKFDKLVSKRMETVRQAKTLPKMTRPGSAASPAAAQSATAEREQAAISAFQRDRSGDAAAALLFTRTR